MKNPPYKAAIPCKIGIFGLFGQQNWGNECTLQATLWNIRNYLPDSEIYCICTNPEDTAARFNIPSYKISADVRSLNMNAKKGLKRWHNILICTLPSEIQHWFRAFDILNNTNVIIFPGTGLLTDFEGKIYGRCYEIFKWAILSKIRRCKIIFLSMGAGPIRHPLNRLFIRLALSMADYRSYRNDHSKTYLKGIGVDVSKDAIYPDLAFSLPKGMFDRKEIDDNLVVGIGIIDYNEKYCKSDGDGFVYEKFLEKLCSFLIWLLGNKYTVRLLVGDTLYDESVKKDLKYRLQEHVGNRYDEYILDDPINSVEQLLIQLSSVHVVISPRLHNLILSIMLGKPVISLSYHEKINSLMKDFELNEYNLEIDNLNTEELIAIFLRLIEERENLLRHIKDKEGESARLLEVQYGYIFKDKLIWA